MSAILPPRLRIIEIDGVDLFYAYLRNEPLLIENQEDAFDKRFNALMPPNLDLCYLQSKGKLVMRRLDNEFYTFDFVDVCFNDTLYLDEKGCRVRPTKNDETKDYEKKYSPKEIRKHLYLKGFAINDKTYVRYKRSSGAAKAGNCLFVRKDRLAMLNDWSRTGLDEELDLCYENLTSYEAYRALSLSSLIKALSLEPKNILFVKDAKIKLKDQNVIRVDVEEGNLVAHEGKFDVENNIFDGEGLMDESVFHSHGLSDKGMMLLRARFFKCCAFNTKLKQWFADNDIHDLKQLNGITLADSIDDILLVASESCLKYLKLARGGFSKENIARWCHEIDQDEVKFGIVKTDKPTRFFDGDMVETTYQLLNTLCLRSKDIRTLINPEVDYIAKIRDIAETPEFVRFYLEGEDGRYDEDEEESEDTGGVELAPSDTKYSRYTFKNKICLELLRLDGDVKYTGLFKDRVYRSIIDALCLRLYNGRVLVHGTNATLLGNPFEYLRYIILDENGKSAFDQDNPSSLLGENEVYTTFFVDGAELVGSRSPHTTMGNILVSKNRKLPLVDRYFNLSPQIVVVDAINNNIQYRLNGCDYDSDFLLLSDNPILVNAAKAHYGSFRVPISSFSSVDNKLVNLSKGKKENVRLNLFEIDKKIADNLVGSIINLSQLLNSHLWDGVNADKRFDYGELYSKIAILSILSGAEIDSAKRTPPFDIGKQYRRVLSYAHEKQFDAKDKKPMFFFILKKQYGKKPHIGKIKAHSEEQPGLKTSMDYLWRFINGYSFGEPSKLKTIPFFDLFATNFQTAGLSGPSYKQAEKAVETVLNLSKELSNLEKEAKASNFEMSQLRFASLMEHAFNDIWIAIKGPKKALHVLQILDKTEGGFTPSFALLFLIYSHQDRLGYTLGDLVRADACPMPSLRSVKEGEKAQYTLFQRYHYRKIEYKNVEFSLKK